jgi:hypothetical protein
MKPSEYSWYLFAPKGKHMAFFGRSDKYAGFTAVNDWQENDDHDVITIQEAGPVCWYSEHAVKSVEIAGKDVTSSLKEENGLYLLNPEETDCQIEITVRW